MGTLGWMDNGFQSKAGATPGVFEHGVFVFMTMKDDIAPDPDTMFLSSYRCSWSARLSRYIATQLLPEHENFIIINGAQGGVGSMYFLLKAHQDWESKTAAKRLKVDQLPAAAKERFF